MKKGILLIIVISLILISCTSVFTNVTLHKNSIQVQKFEREILHKIAMDVSDYLEQLFLPVKTKILLNTSITIHTDFDIVLKKAIKSKGFVISTATLINRANNEYKNISYLLDSFGDNSVFLYLYLNHNNCVDFFYTKGTNNNVVLIDSVNKI